MIETVRLGVRGRRGILWDGLDFAAGEGEILVIAGPPSCGKSVLMAVLSGRMRPHAGEVLVGGRSLYREGEKQILAFRAAAGVVEENFLWPPGRTVRDIFRLSALAGRFLPPAELRAREEELLALVGLPEAAPWEIRALSLSERARVALAVELLHGPRYLFVDALFDRAGAPWEEALSGLLRALAKEGATVVAAERRPPARLVSASAEGDRAGPFCLFRWKAAGSGRAA